MYFGCASKTLIPDPVPDPAYNFGFDLDLDRQFSFSGIKHYLINSLMQITYGTIRIVNSVLLRVYDF